MKCQHCQSEFTAKRSTARYCSAKCRVAASRSVTDEPVSVTESVTVSDGVTPEPVTVTLPEIPGVKPLGLPLTPTGSTCSSFQDLPKGVRLGIDSLTVWCEAKGIAFDRDAQIERAIHYQRYVKAG